MQLLDLWPRTARAAVIAAATAAGWPTPGRRRTHDRPVGGPAPLADVVVDASRRRCRRWTTSPTRSTPATGRSSSPRPAGMRTSPPSGPGSSSRCRGRRRAEPLARRGAVPPARRDRGRLVRGGRRVRAVGRRVAPARQGRPPVGHRPGPRAPDHRPSDPRWASPTATRTTAAALEVVGIRAGAAPGTHLVTFDGPGESVELRLDRPRPIRLRRWRPRRRPLAPRRAARRRPPPVRRRRGRPARRATVAVPA